MTTLTTKYAYDIIKKNKYTTIYLIVVYLFFNSYLIVINMYICIFSTLKFYTLRIPTWRTFPLTPCCSEQHSRDSPFLSLPRLQTNILNYAFSIIHPTTLVITSPTHALFPTISFTNSVNF